MFRRERFVDLEEIVPSEETTGFDSVAKWVRGAKGEDRDEMTYHQDASKTYPLKE